MIRSMNAMLIGILAALAQPTQSHAQYTGDIQAGLERLAASDPQLSEALERLSSLADTAVYSWDELDQNVSIKWFQYRLSPDNPTMLQVEAVGSGANGANLGSGLSWTDKETGEMQSLSYKSQSQLYPDGAFVVEVTVERDGQPAVTTVHKSENLGPVTVVLKELDDGSRHIARFVPTLEPKVALRDYAHALTMSLTSAALLVDGQFAGEFNVSGEIVGIVSGRAGTRIELGLKPFADAEPLGRTDGRTIRFEHDGHRFKIYSTSPITKPADVATEWNVYVRVESTDARGTGTYVKSYDAVLIQEAIDSLNR